MIVDREFKATLGCLDRLTSQQPRHALIVAPHRRRIGCVVVHLPGRPMEPEYATGASIVMVNLDAQGPLQRDALVRTDASFEYHAQRAIQPFHHQSLGLTVRVKVPVPFLLQNRRVEEFLALVCLQDARCPLTLHDLAKPAHNGGPPLRHRPNG